MAQEAAAADEDEPRRGGKRALLLGAVLALAGAAAGFGAVRAGLVPGFGAPAATAGKGGAGAGEGADHGAGAPPPPVGVFVPIEPITVSVTGGRSIRQLRFRAQLEVPPGAEKEVARLMPRIVDVLNGYLRALRPSDLSEPAILVRLRAQMLRRIGVVVGAARVRDLLIMEFVMN